MEVVSHTQQRKGFALSAREMWYYTNTRPNGPNEPNIAADCMQNNEDHQTHVHHLCLSIGLRVIRGAHLQLCLL